jgi:hypothetical protein
MQQGATEACNGAMHMARQVAHLVRNVVVAPEAWRRQSEGHKVRVDVQAEAAGNERCECCCKGLIAHTRAPKREAGHIVRKVTA